MASGEEFYHFHHKERKTYEDAKSICRSEGAFLLTLKSSSKQQFVERSFANGTKLCLDLVQVGMDLKAWKWSNGDENGAAVKYTNWIPGQPNQADQKCAVAVVGKGWRDVECSKTFDIVCEKTVVGMFRYSRCCCSCCC